MLFNHTNRIFSVWKEGDESLKKMMKFIMFTFVLFGFITMPVQAANTGSITVELQDSIDKLPKDKVVFEWVQVASCNDGFYILNDEFKTLDVDFNTELKAEELELIQNHILEMDLKNTNTIETNEKGIGTISNVEEGIYFLNPVDTHEYENVKSMLVSVPEWNDDVLSYNVHVYPKHSPLNKLILHKIDQSSKEEINTLVEFSTFSDANCNQKVYIKETKAPNGYQLSNRVICLEVKNHEMYIDGKKQDSGYILEFENKKQDIPTGIHSQMMFFIVVCMSSIGVFIFSFRKA